MFDFLEAGVRIPRPIDQQLSSRLFQLPVELRVEIYKLVVPSEITLQEPSATSYYRESWLKDAGGIAVSCRRAAYEFSDVPLPRIHLRLPSLDKKTNMELGSFDQHLIPAVESVTVQSPSWEVRPDRFQWSADHDELWFDEANRFLDRCVNLRLLVIEADGHGFTLLVDFSLRNLKPLRTRAGVEVEVRLLREKEILNRMIGPTDYAVREVIAAIKGQAET